MHAQERVVGCHRLAVGPLGDVVLELLCAFACLRAHHGPHLHGRDGHGGIVAAHARRGHGQHGLHVLAQVRVELLHVVAEALQRGHLDARVRMGDILEQHVRDVIADLLGDASAGVCRTFFLNCESMKASESESAFTAFNLICTSSSSFFMLRQIPYRIFSQSLALMMSLL